MCCIQAKLALALGGVATVQLILPVGTIADTFRRYGPTPADPADHWYAFDFDGVTGTGATFAGNTVTLKIRDGAAGDDDLTANGQVTDPGAPAIGPAAAVASWELY